MIDSALKVIPTKDRLVATAAELLLRQSYGTVSVEDICKAAGVQKGTFYHYFPSKNDLALAAYDYMWKMAREKFDPCFSPTVDPLKRLENYAELSYQFHRECYEKEGKIYGCPIATAGQEMGAQDDRIRLKSKEIFDLYCTYFESTLRDMPTYQKLSKEKIHGMACEMFSYALGVLYQAKIVNDPAVIKRDMLAGLKRLVGVS